MNPLRRATWIQLPLLAAVCLTPACTRKEKVVARVADESITQAQWKCYAAEVPKPTPRQAALEGLVRREVAWEQARRQGLLKGEAWQAVAPRLRRTVLIRAYLDNLPGRPPASETEVKGYYLSHGEERHVQHILSKTAKEAWAAHQRLKHGEPFERVAEALSADPTVAKNHGDLGWIKRGTVVPEFSQAVFSAKEGDLCGPFQSQFGWHLAVVKEKRSPTAEDFEKNKLRLMEEARELVNAPKRQEALKPLREQYPLVVDQALLELNPQTTKPKPEDGKRVVGTVGRVGITLRELETFMLESMGGGGFDHSVGAATRKRFLDLYGDDIRLALAAEKAGLDKRPAVQAAIWQAWRKAVYKGFKVNHLRGLKVSDKDLAAHHAQFPDRFLAIGAVKVYLLVAQDQLAAAEAAKEAAKGTPWKKLVDKYANKDSTGAWDAGFLEIAALKKILPPEVVTALQNEPKEAILGPVDGPEGPMLFKVLDRRPGPVMPLDQCKDTVRVDYLATHGEEILEKYLDGEGRQGIPVQLFPENLLP